MIVWREIRGLKNEFVSNDKWQTIDYRCSISAKKWFFFLQTVSTGLPLSHKMRWYAYNAVSNLPEENFYSLNMKVSLSWIYNFFSLEIPVSILLTRRCKFAGTFTSNVGKMGRVIFLFLHKAISRNYVIFINNKLSIMAIHVKCYNK